MTINAPITIASGATVTGLSIAGTGTITLGNFTLSQSGGSSANPFPNNGGYFAALSVTGYLNSTGTGSVSNGNLLINNGGTLNVTAGSLSVSSITAIGNNGAGNLVISGGTFSQTGNYLGIGQGTGAAGSLTVSGSGTLTVSGSTFYVGQSESGTLNHQFNR
jgi:T5SS/PEP-CTERM-associated repeat protein